MNYKVKNLNWIIVVHAICFFLNASNNDIALIYCMTTILMQAVTLLFITVNHDLKTVIREPLPEKNFDKKNLVFSVSVSIVLAIIVSFLSSVSAPIIINDPSTWSLIIILEIFSFIALTFPLLYQIACIINRYSIIISDDSKELNTKHIIKYLNSIKYLYNLYLFIVVCFTVSNVCNTLGIVRFTESIKYVFVYAMQVVILIFLIVYLVFKELVSRENHLDKSWFFHFTFATLIIFIATIFSHTRETHSVISNFMILSGGSCIASISLFLRAYQRAKSLPVDTSSF